MNCVRCKKNCLESELVDGLCYECRNRYKSSSGVFEGNNLVAQAFKAWCFAALIVGIILSIILFVNDYGLLLTIVCISSSLVVFLFLRAIAEIIQLLEDIKNK